MVEDISKIILIHFVTFMMVVRSFLFSKVKKV